jgi:hypothetical protein
MRSTVKWPVLYTFGLGAMAVIGYLQLMSSQSTVDASQASFAMLPPADAEAARRAAAKADALEARVDMLATFFPNLLTTDYSLPFNAYYVNMDTSVGRRRIMERTFGRVWGPRLRRAEGVRGSDKALVYSMIADEPLANQTWEVHSKASRSGLSELGAILSHLQLVKRAYLGGEEVALVLEDDVSPYFMPYWPVGLGELVRRLQNTTWDTVQLSYFMGPTMPKVPPGGRMLAEMCLKVRACVDGVVWWWQYWWVVVLVVVVAVVVLVGAGGVGWWRQ